MGLPVTDVSISSITQPKYLYQTVKVTRAPSDRTKDVNSFLSPKFLRSTIFLLQPLLLVMKTSARGSL